MSQVDEENIENQRPVEPCSGLRKELKECILASDCVKKHGLKPNNCLDANAAGVSDNCRKVQYAFFECKRSLFKDLPPMFNVKDDGTAMTTDVECIWKTLSKFLFVSFSLSFNPSSVKSVERRIVAVINTGDIENVVNWLVKKFTKRRVVHKYKKSSVKKWKRAPSSL